MLYVKIVSEGQITQRRNCNSCQFKGKKMYMFPRAELKNYPYYSLFPGEEQERLGNCEELRLYRKQFP
jgi:hypothetical protein